MLRVCCSPPNDQAFVGTVHFDLEIAPSCADGGTVVLTYLSSIFQNERWSFGKVLNSSPPFAAVLPIGENLATRCCFECYPISMLYDQCMAMSLCDAIRMTGVPCITKKKWS